MTNPLNKQDLADLFGIDIRTVYRWIARGCPTVRGPEGEELFLPDQVRQWKATQAERRDESPHSPPDPTPFAPSSAGVPRDVRQRAEAAKALASARRAELEVQAEKGLKELGLDEKILQAASFEDLATVGREVAAAALRGDLVPGRATVVRQLVSDVRQSMLRALQATEEKDELGRMLLLTEESAEVAQLFDALCNGWRRRWVLEALRAHLREDEREFPAGEVAEGWAPPLSALGLDLAGNATGDWPVYLPPPAVPPAQHTAPSPSKEASP